MARKYSDGLLRAVEILQEAKASAFTDARTDEVLEVVAQQCRRESEQPDDEERIAGGPRPGLEIQWPRTDEAVSRGGVLVGIFAEHNKRQVLDGLRSGMRIKVARAFRDTPEHVLMRSLADGAAAVGLTVEDIVSWV